MVQRATAAGVELNAAAYNVMLKELRLEGDSDGYARLKVGSHFRLRCAALCCAALRLIRAVPYPIVAPVYRAPPEGAVRLYAALPALYAVRPHDAA